MIYQVSRKYRIKSKVRFIIFLAFSFVMSITIANTIIGANNANSMTIPQYASVEINHGDNLWNIAAELGPDGQDIRQTINHICAINDISPESLQPGMIIEVPLSYM